MTRRSWLDERASELACYNSPMATAEQIASLMPAIVVPSSSGMTLSGFRRWLYSLDFPKRGRVTFVKGRVIIEMCPEWINSHVIVKGEIYRVISDLVKARNLGEFYACGARMTNEDANVSSEPDSSFASWETLKTGRLAPPHDRPQDDEHIELVGTPDWVCEIVSDSSVEKDKQHLMQAYHKAGIREYWLIDARWANIEFTILVWEPGGYRSVEPSDGWLNSAVFGCDFRLVRDRDDLGGWDYELQHRTASTT
jgi:Uma2 family endonuclease